MDNVSSIKEWRTAVPRYQPATNLMINKKALIISAAAAVLCSATLAFSGCDKAVLTAETEPISAADVEAVTEALENADRYSEIVPDKPSGIYLKGEQPGEITLTYDQTLGEVRYTNNCATPVRDSKIAKNNVIPLSYDNTGDGETTQTVIRCAAFDADGNRTTEVYTFVYTAADEDRFTMPVISVVSDKRNFYSNETGILVPGKLRDEVTKHGNPKGWQPWYDNANYYGRGIEWERPISLNVFDENGSEVLWQNCGVRVSGGYTRVNTQKSLRFYARRDYTPDTGVFSYSFWPGLRGSHTGTPASFSDTVLLRGGSNNEGNAVFTTPSLLLLLQGTDLDCPAITPVVEFINGRYAGIVTQLEDFDEDFFLVNYGVEKEDLTTMKGTVGELLVPAGWHVDDGPASEETEFYKMLDFIGDNDMRDDENYSRACEMIDMQNFIEYIAFEMYVGNTDWPDNNMRAWRYNKNGYDPTVTDGIHDGRWRFLTKDLDLSFGYGSYGYDNDPYSFMRGRSHLRMKNLFSSLIKNEEFSDLFYTYMYTLAEAVMAPERVEHVFDLMQVYTGRETAYSISTLKIAGGSRGNWNWGFDVLRSYALGRPSYIEKYTKKAAGRGVSSVTMNIENGDMGEVRLGWFGIDNGDTRSYLQKTRIPLEVNPADGCDYEISYYACRMVDGYLIADGVNASVTVKFKESAENADETPAIVINEVVFRGTDRKWIELYNTTDEDYVLHGWSIGKQNSSSKARVLQNTTIPAHGYALVCSTDYSNSRGAAGLYITMSFGDGDTLYLFDKAGAVVDSVSLSSPSKTVHLGRIPDGGALTELSPDEATPGSANRMDDPFTPYFSEKFEPYLLAWGRVYELDDYFYEKDGTMMVKSSSLTSFLAESSGAELLRYMKKQTGDITLDSLVEASREMSGSVRYLPELKSVIIG